MITNRFGLRRLTPRTLVVALGAWLIISAFAWQQATSQRINCALAGLTCVILARLGRGHESAHRLCLAVGAWILLSLFLIWPGQPLTAWSNVLTGMGISAMAALPPDRQLIRSRRF
jgi:hypothetical protein